jgi:peptidoglycan lytic transglycosylase
MPLSGAIRHTLAGASFFSALACAAVVCLVLVDFARPVVAYQKKGSHASTHAETRHEARAPRKTSSAPAKAEQELRQLTRALTKEYSDARYQSLVRFAEREDRAPLGARAALALGFCDYNQNRFADARKWLIKAEADPLLGDYALYWLGMTDHAADANEAAVEELHRFREQYPRSVMTMQAVQALAQSALAANQPEVAVAALDGYDGTSVRAALLLLRAQAQEQVAAARGIKPLAAARDYLRLYYHFPLSDEAKIAGDKIPDLQAALGEQFPGTPLEAEIARAETLYNAGRWKDMQAAYRELLPKLSGESRERAELRIAQAGVQLGASPDTLASLHLSDPELDAERIYALSQAQRSANVESDMLAAVEQLVNRYTHSYWAERALFAVGNYYWVNLDRDHAAQFYQRVLGRFPQGRYADVARWRIVWTAYLERRPDLRQQLEDFLRRYPTSAYANDALYFLGRANEAAGDAAQARTFYLATVDRFPQTYFGECAAERLRAIGRRPVARVAFLSGLPRVSRMRAISDPPLPAAARRHSHRAQALRTIAFDNSAGLELRAAYSESHSRQLLLLAAQTAIEGGSYAAGIVVARELVPDLESQQFREVPREVWRAAFPLPYEPWLNREARRNRLDPMLVAGLIRQESAFASDALSHSGAMGLMQVMPFTGNRVARSMQVRFSRARLFDPQYNLRLGSRYLSTLLSTYGKPEEALAAYNAGPNRVAAWMDGQNYQEMAEFVESIPFSETRNYVQVVLRNAAVYRRLYSRHDAVPAAPESSAARR